MHNGQNSLIELERAVEGDDADVVAGAAGAVVVLVLLHVGHVDELLGALSVVNNVMLACDDLNLARSVKWNGI